MPPLFRSTLPEAALNCPLEVPPPSDEPRLLEPKPALPLVMLRVLLLVLEVSPKPPTPPPDNELKPEELLLSEIGLLLNTACNVLASLAASAFFRYTTHTFPGCLVGWSSFAIRAFARFSRALLGVRSNSELVRGSAITDNR